MQPSRGYAGATGQRGISPAGRFRAAPVLADVEEAGLTQAPQVRMKIFAAVLQQDQQRIVGFRCEGNRLLFAQQEVLHRVKDKGAELVKVLSFLVHATFGDFLENF
jgi:hypothetical protein